VATSQYTHELWEPLPGTFEDYHGVFLDGYTRRISEYNLSRNLAKYGLKISGIMRRKEDFYHINLTTDDIRKPEDVAIAKLKEWGVR
jgi:endo-1,4-beta-D-glucanase Y